MKAGSWLPTQIQSCSKIQSFISNKYFHTIARRKMCYSFAEKERCVIVICERHTTPEAPCSFHSSIVTEYYFSVVRALLIRKHSSSFSLAEWWSFSVRCCKHKFSHANLTEHLHLAWFFSLFLSDHSKLWRSGITMCLNIWYVKEYMVTFTN